VGERVADIWYYADDGEAKGPFAFRELIGSLSAVSDPTKILVWRYGFEGWKRVDQVTEIEAQLFRPPPIPKRPPPLPKFSIQPALQTTGKPSVSEAEAAQFKHLKADLSVSVR
jgi:GYF domain 2